MVNINVCAYTLKEAFDFAIEKNFRSSKPTIDKFLNLISADTIDKVMVDYVDENAFSYIATSDDRINYYVCNEEFAAALKTAIFLNKKSNAE